MTKGFQVRGDKNNPYHLSVGAVAIKGKNIALLEKPDGFFTLPRETLYSKENITEGLNRGLEEELGVKVEIIKYLGGLINHFHRPDTTEVEKTTIYFLTLVKGQTEKIRQKDELEDKVIWASPEKAINELKKCNNKEHIIVQRAKKSF